MLQSELLQFRFVPGPFGRKTILENAFNRKERKELYKKENSCE